MYSVSCDTKAYLSAAPRGAQRAKNALGSINCVCVYLTLIIIIIR
jgi:hypothetical protein